MPASSASKAWSRRRSTRRTHLETVAYGARPKRLNRQEFVVVGWSDPEGSRPHLGALLLGYYTDDGKLIYAGRVGTGMPVRVLADLRRRLDPLARKTSPLSIPPPRGTRFGSPLVLSRIHWVEPKLVAEITYLTWTADNLLRHTVLRRTAGGQASGAGAPRALAVRFADGRGHLVAVGAFFPTMMIGITISGKAYAEIAATLPARLGAENEVSPDNECLVWLPRALVHRLLALREPEETFSDVILRLAERGSFAVLAR
jgi:hypothetical protein